MPREISSRSAKRALSQIDVVLQAYTAVGLQDAMNRRLRSKLRAAA
jgi:hypothetical protein